MTVKSMGSEIFFGNYVDATGLSIGNLDSLSEDEAYFIILPKAKDGLDYVFRLSPEFLYDLDLANVDLGKCKVMKSRYILMGGNYLISSSLQLGEHDTMPDLEHRYRNESVEHPDLTGLNMYSMWTCKEQPSRHDDIIRAIKDYMAGKRWHSDHQDDDLSTDIQSLLDSIEV